MLLGGRAKARRVAGLTVDDEDLMVEVTDVLAAAIGVENVEVLARVKEEGGGQDLAGFSALPVSGYPVSCPIRPPDFESRVTLYW